MLRVSVVIPTYKHRQYVLETLNSVFAQTVSADSYEVIVINDGSPDDTADVLRPLADAGKIRYIAQENQGQSAARNRGISEARGEFIALLDDDDRWPPEKLAWQLQAMDRTPEAVLVYGDAQFITEEVAPNGTMKRTEGRRFPGPGAPSGHIWERFVAGNYLQSPGQALIRTQALREIGGFDPAIWGADDYDLYLRLAKRGTFLYEEKLALLYRFHEANASKNVARMYANVARVRRKHLGLFPRPGMFRFWLANYRYTSRIFGDDFVNATGDALRQGDKPRARSLWLRAILVRPAFLGQRHTYYLLKNLI